jgi:exopolysaccharide biosynthesis polyprenyl glycosylphosphotransferase
MLRVRRILARPLLAAADAVTLIAAFLAAYEVCRICLKIHLLGLTNYAWIVWLIIPTWTLLLRNYGLYNSASYESWPSVLRALLHVQALASLVMLAAMYVTKSEVVSRGLLHVFVIISYAALVMEKAGIRRVLLYARRRKLWHLRKVLLVGTAADAADYPHILQDRPNWGSEVVGVLLTGEHDLHNCSSDYLRLLTRANGKPILGRVEEFATILGQGVIDEVVVVSTSCPQDEANELALTCAHRGITFRMIIQMPHVEKPRYHGTDLGSGAYLISLDPISRRAAAIVLKRMVDIIAGCVGLLICAFTYLWYARRLRCESPGSVFFKQTRVGQNGRIFECYKFRTMYPDAEARRHELLANNEMAGPIFKMKNDPRVTPTGRVLRRRHLDELPQFWNVLKGEMSLVGTRPPTLNEVAAYEPRHHRRLSMKPGMTGIWQIAGNGVVNNFEDVVKLDWGYIQNWSPRLDAEILVKTVAKVMRGDGW